MNKKIISSKGSLSLEAAVVVPLFLFAVIGLLSILEFYKADIDMNTNVYSVSKELALYSWVKDVSVSSGNVDDIPDIVGTGLSDAYAYMKVSDRYRDANGQKNRVLENDLSPLNFIFSSEKNDVIDIVCTYRVSPWINYYNVSPWLIVNRARTHMWNGYELAPANTKDDERIVYIAENGTVYHLAKSCTYLDLSIKGVGAEQLEFLRNAGGAKYTPCKKCKPSLLGQLYITDYGDNYHNTISCSGLKRTIREVPISQVGDMKCCSKCAGKG